VVLVGCHRKSVKLIRSVADVIYLENFKVRPMYKKGLCEIAKNRSDDINGAFMPIGNKQEMQRLAEIFPEWIKCLA
jgi:hypothetical protein